MDDAFGVGSVKGISNFDPEAKQDFRFQRPRGKPVFQGRTFQVLHDDEGLVILFTDVINGANVGMVEGGGCLRFTAKAAQGLGIASDFIG